MVFTIDTDIIENDEVRLTENSDGDLALEHIPSGQTLTVDEGANVGDIKQQIGGLSADGTEATLDSLDVEEISNNGEYIDIERARSEQGLSLDPHQRNLGNFGNVGRMWDNFEHTIDGTSFGDWELIDGSWEVDTNNNHTGTQSLKLMDDGNGIRIERPASVNFGNYRLAITGMLESNDSNGFFAQAYDSADNWSRMQGLWSRQSSNENVGFWTGNMGFVAVTSSMDHSDVTTLEFWSDSFGGGTFWIDSIRLVPVPDTGRILLDFDAGATEEMYNNHRPVISEYGYVPGIGNSNWSELGTDGYMTEDQARELAEEYGWKLRPHVRFRDLFDAGDFPYTEDDYEEAILDALTPLLDMGLTTGIRDFTFLGNQENWESQQVVQRFANTSRRTGGGGVFGVPANPLDIPGRNFDDGLSDVQDVIDITVENGGYARIYAHSSDQLTETELRNVLDYVQQYEQSGDLVVMNIDDAYEEWRANARTTSL